MTQSPSSLSSGSHCLNKQFSPSSAHWHVHSLLSSWHSRDSRSQKKRKVVYPLGTIFPSNSAAGKVWLTGSGQSRLLLQVSLPASLRQKTSTPLAALACDPGQESSPEDVWGNYITELEFYDYPEIQLKVDFSHHHQGCCCLSS